MRHLEARQLVRGDATELYVNAVPPPHSTAAEQALRAFTFVADCLRAHDAHLFQERIFAAPEAVEEIRDVRRHTYGHVADAVPPTWLVSHRVGRDPRHGPVAGVQVHAVRSVQPPRDIRLDGMPVGRFLSLGEVGYVTLSGIAAPEAGRAPDQARAVLERAERALRQVGGDWRSVARTWLWLGDILQWYGDFNAVRTGFFRERGLIGAEVRLPASTGIGVKPMGSAACALDLVALVGGDGLMTPLAAAGNQGPAYDYGSAFSRALRAPTLAGETLFVSGTAAIDAAGRTCCPDDAAGQIRMSIGNVHAVMNQAGLSDTDVVQAMAYCKTAHVEQTFLDEWGDLSWPCVIAAADICRPDLLFEIEVTCCCGARRVCGNGRTA